MTKPLLLTSLCAFVAAIAFFTLSLGVLASGAGSHSWKDVAKGEDWFDGGHYVSGEGPDTTRDLPWAGGDKLTVSIPANVHFTQGPVGSVHISGQQGAVEHVVLRDGELQFDRRVHDAGRMEITVTAPSVTSFVLAGSQRLEINGYQQDHLDASIAGSGDITIHGAADRTELSIAGSGDIDAGGLVVKEATVNIAGSGDATIAPTERAKVEIAGSGDVTLKTQTAKVESHIMGSGKVVQDPQ